MVRSSAENSLSHQFHQLDLLVETIIDLENSDCKNLSEKKSAILNTLAINAVTIWESYIREIIYEAAENIAYKSKSPSVLSESVLLSISNNLISNTKKNPKKIWILAGDGWRAAYVARVNNLVRSFYSPRHEKIDSLMKNTIGIKKISSSWRWQGTSSKSVIKKLDNWINIRGGLVHRMDSLEDVSFKQVVEIMELILRCASITSNRVRTHVHKTIDEYPWDEVSYKSSK